MHRIPPLAGLGTVLVLALTPAVLSAQGFGVHVGYDSESEEELVGITGHIPISIGKVPKTTLSPSLEIFLTDFDNIFVAQVGLSVRFHPWAKPESKVSPYFGPGLLLLYDDFTEEVQGDGLAIAGLEFPVSTAAPFVHVQFGFGDFDQSALVVGLNFNF